MTSMPNKSYLELITIDDFLERIKYLQTNSRVGEPTFSGHRYINQRLYNSYDWEKTRNRVILRDKGLDLAHQDFPIRGGIYVHHINPITEDDIINMNPCVFDLNNLISTSIDTHNIIHYGYEPSNQVTNVYIERYMNDTCPWRW